MKSKIDFTLAMDEELRSVYSNYIPGQIIQLAERWDCSHRTLRKRANQLQLPRLRSKTGEYRRWTISEVRLLSENEHLTCRQLEKVFYKQGCQRSAGSIDCFRRKHLDWLDKHSRDEFNIGYTTFQVRDLLKIDHTTILRWIKKGWLEAKIVEGPNHRIRREHLLKFLIENPAFWDIRKVDMYWFLDLIQEHMRFHETSKRNVS